jgi:hypothetical protein
MSDMGQAGQHASEAPRHCVVRVADAALMLLLMGAAETLPSRRRKSRTMRKESSSGAVADTKAPGRSHCTHRESADEGAVPGSEAF